MAQHAFSLAAFTQPAFESALRGATDPGIVVKSNNNHTTSGGCCSGGGHHGCGCGCKGCMCRLTLVKESNPGAYPGEGGRQGMPSPDIDLPNHASSFDSSLASVRTDDSRSQSEGSFNNSYEAQGHLDGHHTASAYVTGAGNQFAAFEEEEDGHNVWEHFVNPSDSLDRAYVPTEEEDSSGMIITGEMDDSTDALRGSDIILDDRVLLTSEYESSWVPPSATASQILPGVGAAFGQHFLIHPLRLSPECRHSINHSICANCVH